MGYSVHFHLVPDSYFGWGKLGKTGKIILSTQLGNLVETDRVGNNYWLA